MLRAILAVCLLASTPVLAKSKPQAPSRGGAHTAVAPSVSLTGWTMPYKPCPPKMDWGKHVQPQHWIYDACYWRK